MKKTIIWSVLLVLGQLSSTSRAQSQEDIAKRLAGMWRLVSNPQRLVDGTTREGSNSVGYAFFDANAGHMCFLSMNPNLPQWRKPRRHRKKDYPRSEAWALTVPHRDPREGRLYDPALRDQSNPTRWAKRPTSDHEILDNDEGRIGRIKVGVTNHLAIQNGAPFIFGH